MKLLFDENLSPRLVDRLARDFPGSAHVDALGLHGKPDAEIWKHAGEHGFVIADQADLEDVYETERHLLYVACTRARDHLLVTGVEPASELLDDLAGRR